jgi:hypothetical protein
MSTISNVGINIADKAALIWNVADMLRGPFKPHEYGLVILPMTVVKRFHDCLLPTHTKVLEAYEKVKGLEVVDGFLSRASGYQFYNTSQFTFETLLADSENIEANFKDYLAGFSGNVQDVLATPTTCGLVIPFPKISSRDISLTALSPTHLLALTGSRSKRQLKEKRSWVKRAFCTWITKDFRRSAVICTERSCQACR